MYCSGLASIDDSGVLVYGVCASGAAGGVSIGCGVGSDEDCASAACIVSWAGGWFCCCAFVAAIDALSADSLIKRCAVALSARGIDTKNVLPFLYSLSTHKRPPIVSASRRHKYNPRPVPLISRVSVLSTR